MSAHSPSSRHSNPEGVSVFTKTPPMTAMPSVSGSHLTTSTSALGETRAVMAWAEAPALMRPSPSWIFVKVICSPARIRAIARSPALVMVESTKFAIYLSVPTAARTVTCSVTDTAMPRRRTWARRGIATWARSPDRWAQPL